MDHIESNLNSYAQGFSPEAREIFDVFVHRCAVGATHAKRTMAPEGRP